MKQDYYSINRTERQLLIGYESFVSISSLIGDMLILVGSLRYNAIKLHKVIVTFIQYIAVADLSVTVFSILPGTVSLAANDWILGDILCYLDLFAYASCASFVCQLMAAIAFSKLLIVKYPLRAISFPSKTAHLVACGMLVCSFIFPTATIATDKSGVYFDYDTYNCDYDWGSDKWTKTGIEVYSTAIGLTLLTCAVITIVSSVLLLVVARRIAGRGLQWQGVLTVLLTVTVHSLISIPSAIYYTAHFISPGADLVNLYTFAVDISFVGVTANFYIFTLTLSSFRGFLKSRMRAISTLVVRSLRCCTASEGEGEERRRLLD